MGGKKRSVGEGKSSNACGRICNRRKKDGLHDKIAKIGQPEPISNSVECLRQNGLIQPMITRHIDGIEKKKLCTLSATGITQIWLQF